jgi:ubiquinol-cytochrome c reductase cytochrome c subunit
MRWIAARRRRAAAGYTVVLLGLLAIGLGYAAITAGGGAAAAVTATGGTSPRTLLLGKQLFIESCSSCHGLEAQGTSNAPSLIGVGAAAVDFQMSTGRMPGKELGPEMLQGPTRFTTAQIHDIAAYIQALGGGPTIPSAAQVSTRGANLALGQSLFITDCAQCHNFDGAGGALTDGKSAPPLDRATPVQIYEAMETGPEAMPNFSELPDPQKRAIIAYLTRVRSQPNPGGFSLGRVGPVTEGLVAFLGGIAALVFAALWLTMKRRST